MKAVIINSFIQYDSNPFFSKMQILYIEYNFNLIYQYNNYHTINQENLKNNYSIHA